MGNKTNIPTKNPLYSKTFWRNNHGWQGLISWQEVSDHYHRVSRTWTPTKTFALRQSKVGSGTLVSIWLDILLSGKVVTVHTVGSLEPTYTRLNFNTELASSWWYENFAWRCPLQLLFNHFTVLSSNFSQDIWPISNPQNVSASAPKIAWSVFFRSVL